MASRDALVLLVVDTRADRQENYVKQHVARCRDTERGLHANQHWPNIEAAPHAQKIQREEFRCGGVGSMDES